MKVPTYTSKLQRTNTAGGGAMLNASMSLSAAAAQGKAMESVGDQVFNLGYEKYKVQATSEINETMPYFTAEIEGIKEKYKNSHNPVEAEKKVKSEMQDVYKKYLRGKTTNAGGNSFLSSNLARSGFNTKANNLITQGLLNWKKENNKYIVALNKTNHVNDIKKNDDIAGDINLGAAQRLKGFENNFKIMNLKGVISETQKLLDGKYSYLSRNNIFSAKEITSQRENSLNNIGFSITNSIIGSQKYSPMMVSETLFTGDVEKIKIVDPILAKVWEKMDGKQRTEFLKKVRTEEKAYYDDLKVRNEITEKKNNAADQKILREIFNVDVNDQNAVTEAQQKYQTLLNKKFFIKLSERNAVQKLLYPDQDDPDKKSDPATLNELEAADLNDTLTMEIINNAKPNLTQIDWAKWVKRYKTEKSDAQKFVTRTVINRSFNFDELLQTNAHSKLVGRFNSMRNSVIAAFENWLNQNKQKSYTEIVAEGKKIMEPYLERIEKMYKNSFNDNVGNFKESFISREFRQSGKKFTVDNILNFIADKEKPGDAAFKSFRQIFEVYMSVPGYQDWGKINNTSGS